MTKKQVTITCTSNTVGEKGNLTNIPYSNRSWMLDLLLQLPSLRFSTNPYMLECTGGLRACGCSSFKLTVARLGWDCASSCYVTQCLSRRMVLPTSHDLYYVARLLLRHKTSVTSQDSCYVVTPTWRSRKLSITSQQLCDVTEIIAT